MKETRAQGKGPQLHALADPDQVLSEVLELMACRCFVYSNQQSIVRGYLAAMKYFHKMYAGWESSTSHCMIVAVGKGIDRAHEKTPKKVPVRLPLTWSTLSQGQRLVTSMADGGRVMWLGFTLSYFLLCRASESWAYANGKVHPEFCLTRNCLTFLQGEGQVAFENRSSANAVQVRFVASEHDQKRAGCTITRTRVSGETEAGGGLAGAFEALLELLSVHSELPGEAPLTARLTPLSWRVFTRTEAVEASRLMVGSSGRDPAEYALHSGRIGGERSWRRRGRLRCNFSAQADGSRARS